MAEQYRGQFKSLDGVLYTAIISNSSYNGNSQNIPHFAAQGEIEISWKELDKYDVIQGSEAKVTLISESDRQFIDLYTESPGSIRLDVYKNIEPDNNYQNIGTLYWSGCLDCEFYEEPYHCEKNYQVQLTFSDFGILDRLKFDVTEVTPVSIESIMTAALSKSCISESTFNETMIALNKTLSQICVYPSNFYDEDGEASTWADAVKQILQPLSIKMIQKNGVVYLYDLHSLYNASNASTIEWRGNNATLGVDKVFNNCKVTFSPYAQSELIKDDFDVTVDTSQLGQENNNVHTYYKGYHYDENDNYDQKKEGDKDFSVIMNPTFNNVENICAYPISIRKIYGGEDVDAMAVYFPIPNSANNQNFGHVESLHNGYYVPNFNRSVWVPSQHGSLFKTKKILFTKTSNNAFLRFVLPVFVDGRFNPWRDASDTNDKTGYDIIHEHLTFLRLYFRMRLYDEEGNVLYHYINLRYYSDGDKPNSFEDKGVWVEGDYTGTQITDLCKLYYWNRSNAGESIDGSWLDNSHAGGSMNPTDTDPLINSAPAGQYIVLPPESGYIEIEIINMQSCFQSSTDDYVNDLGVYVEWFLLKAPSLVLVNNYSPYDVLEYSDIETNGLIDVNAKEDIEFDFTCGTPSSNLINAKGVYVDSNGSQYHSFTRAGRTDTAEQLFIGTCFSQYASRNTTLSGDVKIDTGALKPYADPYISNRYNNGVATPTGESKKFMMVEDVQKLSEDISDTKFVEFMQDIYTKG